MGYTFTTLREALKQPGVTIRALPPPPTPAPGDICPAGSESSPADGLPEFSPSTLARFLVKFIVADDQVRYLSLSLLSIFGFLWFIDVLVVHQRHRMSGIQATPHVT